MKKVFFAALVGLVFLGISCGGGDYTIDINADKTTLAVGETVTFEVTVSNNDYACGFWWIDRADGSTVESGEIPATTSTAVTYTATEAGTLDFRVEVGTDCNSSNVPIDGISSGQVSFTVTE